MPTSPASSRRELESAWMVLRLAIRSAAKTHAPRLLERANALGGVPVDPAQVETLARKLNDELAAAAAEGEKSPTMRLFRKTFRPNDTEKERRNVEKAWNAYLKLWQAQAP